MNAVLVQPGTGKGRRPTVARAEYLLSIGDAKAAHSCARRLLRRDPAQIGALEVLAKSLWQLSRYDDLLVSLTTLVRLNPYEPGYHALRGAAYQALGRTGEAIKSFARAATDSETASACVEELRDWQGTVIAGMLRDDLVFRTHYAQDREDACRSRGFEFLPDYKPGESWLAKPQSQLAAFTRPS
ncbi:MAG: tetratricopeptide repeat protein [Fimbriimonadales bacterium]